MRSLVVLLVVLTVSFAAPNYHKNGAELSESGHAKKRSFNHGVTVIEPDTFYIAPATIFAAPAVSHQSREDVRTSQTVVSSSPVVIARAVQAVPSPAVVSPVQPVYQVPAVYAGGAAVSHQYREDSKISSVVVPPVVAFSPLVHSVPTVVESIPAVVSARSVYVAPDSVSSYRPNVYATAW